MVMAWLMFGEVLSTTGLIGLGIAAASVGLTLTARQTKLPTKVKQCRSCANYGQCTGPIQPAE